MTSEPGPAYAWEVSGWRRSARLINEATTALSAGLEPSPAEARSAATVAAPPSQLGI